MSRDVAITVGRLAIVWAMSSLALALLFAVIALITFVVDWLTTTTVIILCGLNLLFWLNEVLKFRSAGFEGLCFRRLARHRLFTLAEFEGQLGKFQPQRYYRVLRRWRSEIFVDDAIDIPNAEIVAVMVVPSIKPRDTGRPYAMLDGDKVRLVRIIAEKGSGFDRPDLIL